METIAVIVLYAIIENLIKLLESACAYIASNILDSSITVFSADQNIFETFINLIPFASSINLGAIVKGIAYGVVMLLLMISILKSFTSPLTGDDSINPAQAGIRAAVAIVLIITIFGGSFGTSTGAVAYGGFLQYIGKFFGTALSKIGALPRMHALNLEVHLNPAEYIAAILFDLALITSIVGAALQYVERIVSFAVYIIFGPIAVAMFASKDTSNVTKQWMAGLLSEFLSIFVSIIMWIAFIDSANHFERSSWGGGSMLHYAVMIALLGIMRNSEKIINAMGFRTITLGDSARAAVAGVGLATSSVMMLSRFSSSGTMKNYAGRNSTNVSSVVSPFNSSGQLRSGPSMTMAQAGNVLHSQTFHPLNSVKNNVAQSAVTQNKAMAEVRSAVTSKSSISASTFNSAMGFNSNSTVHAIGNGEKQTLQPAYVKTPDGKNTVAGFMGDAVINRGGQIETVNNMFFPASSADSSSFQPNSPVLVGSDMTESSRYISGNGIMLNGPTPSQNIYAFRTDTSFPDMKKEAERTVIQETVHEPRGD